MSLDLTHDKSILVQVMAWCHQATSHYLSQCWPSSMLPYGVATRPQVVNSSPPNAAYVSVNWVSIGSDNGLSPAQCQAIIWTSVGILLMGPLRTNFSEIRIKIQNFHSWKCIWQYRRQNGAHFVQGEMSYSWFQCSKLMIAPGNPKLGWTNWIWPWIIINYIIKDIFEHFWATKWQFEIETLLFPREHHENAQ